jgi:cytoskeletal protein CcmA (bactofilin family)
MDKMKEMKGDIGAKRIETAEGKKFSGASVMTAKKAGWKSGKPNVEIDAAKSF